MTDTERIDFIAQQVMDEASGGELFPVEARVEYGEDGNTILKILYWNWLGHRGSTFREAIDAAIHATAPR